MTQPFVVWDPATGRIDRWGRAASDDIPAQAGPGEVALAAAGDDAHDWVNPATGLLEQRPAVGLPETASILVGAEWEIAPVPDGSIVRVDGVAVDVVDGGENLVLQFPIAAAWTVEIDPPFPWRPATCRVTTG